MHPRIVAFVITVFGLASPDVPAMDAFAWQKRPLVVIVPSMQAPLREAQRAQVAEHRAGFAERDMAYVEVVGDAVLVDDRPRVDLDAAAIRARYGVDGETSVVLLVGKDTGVKLRSVDAPIAWSTLRATIDAMPMRQREMREGDGDG